MESQIARLACALIFGVNLMNDMRDIYRLWELVIEVPSADDGGDLLFWVITDEEEEDGEEKEEPEENEEEKQTTRFQIRGMPRRWKAIYLALLVFPRSVVWVALAHQGFRFLMETGTVEDVILNSLALGYILDIDELIYAVCTSEVVKRIMEKLEDYDPPAAQRRSTFSVSSALRAEKHVSQASYELPIL